MDISEQIHRHQCKRNRKTANSTQGAQIIDLARARAELRQIDWQAITEERRRGLIKRMAAVKRYIAQVERRTLIGDSGALDWVELHHLPPLEAAIREHSELMELVRVEMNELRRAGKI